MNDAKLSDLLTSLEREEVTVVQVEKNCHKWITHLLNRISGRFSDDFEVVQTVKLILENVGDKNHAANDGRTPLHYAALFGYLDVFSLLLENVKDKNPAANDGQTPLHEGALNGHLHVCKLIIENVANKNPADND